MTHHEDHFAGHDGLELYEQSWLPEQSTGVLVLLHGINEHSGRYASFAEELVAEGWAVYAMDLRGHGRSAGPRSHVGSFDQFVDDLEVFLDRVREREPEKPIFLFGHSMGAAIVLRLVIRREPDVCGMVLGAPPLRIGGKMFPILRRLAGLFSHIMPRLRLVRLGTHFMSRDKAVVEQFRADPLVFHGRFTVRIGAEILRIGKQIRLHSESVRLPFLVMHGTDDICTRWKGSRRLFEEAGSTDKTLCLYPGLWHDLLNEPEKEQVRSDVIRWLNRRRAAVTVREK